ncbi:MAG: hypothetical protein MZV63_58575 [Marinilabiliales bacterium]|nr:hypothetical protein [Marinilabiliales bacterium]
MTAKSPRSEVLDRPALLVGDVDLDELEDDGDLVLGSFWPAPDGRPAGADRGGRGRTRAVSAARRRGDDRGNPAAPRGGPGAERAAMRHRSSRNENRHPSPLPSPIVRPALRVCQAGRTGPDLIDGPGPVPYTESVTPCLAGRPTVNDSEIPSHRRRRSARSSPPSWSVAGRAAAAIPKKDAWYTQHYVIMQDFEKKAYRKLSERGPEGLPGALLGGPDRRGPGHVRSPAGLRQEELLEGEQPAALEHRPLPGLPPQRQPGLDRRRPERRLGLVRHARPVPPGDRPVQRGRRGQPGRGLGLSLR